LHVFSAAVVLLVIVALTNGSMRLVRVPLPLLQIAAGVLAWLLGARFTIDSELFLLVFIPPLLFIEGWRLPKREFQKLRRPILMMAFGLVIFTVFGLGLLLHAVVPGMPLAVAFAIASALSPTDAVAVAGVTGRARLPSALLHVLQGEALFNDASGIVCLRTAVAAMATASFVWWQAAGSLLFVATGGVVVGTIVAFLFSRLQRLVFGASDDAPEGRILLITALPYAAYVAAEEIHVSGILAAAAAGMVLPRVGVFDVGERVSRRQTATVLGALELAMNGMVFVLLGMRLPAIVVDAPAALEAAGFSSWGAFAFAAVSAAAGLFVLRLSWVWVSMRVTLYRRARRAGVSTRVPARIVVVTALAGVRGAVSLAAALTIPAQVAVGESTYAARDVGVALTAAVIVMSLVSASVALPTLVAGIKLPDAAPDEARSALLAELTDAAIEAIARERDAPGRASPDELVAVAEAASGVIAGYRARLAATGDGAPEAKRAGHARRLRVLGIQTERALLEQRFREHAIDDVTYRDVLHTLDVSEEAIVGKRGAGHGG
jgi:Na+/H+ antiporter